MAAEGERVKCFTDITGMKILTVMFTLNTIVCYYLSPRYFLESFGINQCSSTIVKEMTEVITKL